MAWNILTKLVPLFLPFLHRSSWKNQSWTFNLQVCSSEALAIISVSPKLYLLLSTEPDPFNSQICWWWCCERTKTMHWSILTEWQRQGHSGGEHSMPLFFYVLYTASIAIASHLVPVDLRKSSKSFKLHFRTWDTVMNHVELRGVQVLLILPFNSYITPLQWVLREQETSVYLLLLAHTRLSHYFNPKA